MSTLLSCWRVVGAHLASSLGLRLPDQRTFGVLTTIAVGAHLARRLLRRPVLYRMLAGDVQ